MIIGYQEKIDQSSMKYLIDFSIEKYLLDIPKY